MAWTWRHTIAMEWLHAGWQKKVTATITEKHWKSLWPSNVQRGAFYYPIAVKPGCRWTHRGTQEWL